jgi:hypothetical protein
VCRMACDVAGSIPAAFTAGSQWRRRQFRDRSGSPSALGNSNPAAGLSVAAGCSLVYRANSSRRNCGTSTRPREYFVFRGPISTGPANGSNAPCRTKISPCPNRMSDARRPPCSPILSPA